MSDPDRDVFSEPGEAGPIAPLVYDAWYILAHREEVTRKLERRSILGEPVCFYRTEDGRPVAIDDRCPHRRFSLAASHLEGDRVRCGYHGFTFDRTGACVFVPTLPDGAAATKVRERGAARSYPVVERGPWVWIWTGKDPGDADPSTIPWPVHSELDEFVTGYKHYPANYQMVHENLLDFSHVFYLHELHSAEAVATPLGHLEDEAVPEGDRHRSVSWSRSAPATLSVYGAIVGEDPATEVTRTDQVIAVVPAMNYNLIKFDPVDPDSTQVRLGGVMNGITPVDEHTTHYFWALWVNVAMVQDMRPKVAHLLTEVFDQDTQAFAYMQEYCASDRPPAPEFNVRSDAPGLKFRRKLFAAAAAEQQPAVERNGTPGPRDATSERVHARH